VVPAVTVVCAVASGAVVRAVVIVMPSVVTYVSAGLRCAVMAAMPVVIVAVPVSVSAHLVLTVVFGLLSLGV
jgi:hypothetical protein